jgi:hypothetical protein
MRTGASEVATAPIVPFAVGAVPSQASFPTATAPTVTLPSVASVPSQAPATPTTSSIVLGPATTVTGPLGSSTRSTGSRTDSQAFGPAHRLGFSSPIPRSRSGPFGPYNSSASSSSSSAASSSSHTWSVRPGVDYAAEMAAMESFNEYGNYREASTKRSFDAAFLESSGFKSPERPAYNPWKRRKPSA